MEIMVSPDGIKINPGNVNYKQVDSHITKKDVESFLGFMNYHRKHIPGYSNLALPVHEVVRPTIPFVWEDKHQSAFESPKEALINSVILSFPNSTDMHDVHSGHRCFYKYYWSHTQSAT